MRKHISLCLLACASALLLSGCMIKTVDELYMLPKHSDEYNNLQAAIDQTMQQGSGYCAPISGVNQQSVQLADLDGDGEDEAIVFLKDSSEKTLRACIFDQSDGIYRSIATIEGTGTAFACCEYAQLDDTPGLDLILCRQLSDTVSQSMSAYSLHDGHVVELMSTTYSEYTTADLDSDGRKDIFLLRFDTESRMWISELFRYHAGLLEREPEAHLSVGAQSVKRIISGNLMQDVPAVFVASTYEDESIVTDVFAFRNGTFQNVTSSDGLSTQTVRSYFVYASDIDYDGLIELPELISLPASEESGDAYSLIRWFNLDLKNNKTVKMTTYHRFASGWYIVLPEVWENQITISRGEEVLGVQGIVFSRWNDTESPDPIFTVYAFSGEDRNRIAEEDGRFILSEKGDVTYSAKIGTSEWASDLTPQKLKQMFNYIHVDWNSGET